MSRFGKYQKVPSDDHSSENETKPQITGHHASTKSTKPMKSTKPIKSNKFMTMDQPPTAAEKANEQDKKRAIPTPRKAPPYNWAANFDAAEEEAEAAGIVSVPTIDVSRVIEKGRITHVCNLPMCGPDNYIIYDGSDVVACVYDRHKMYPFIYRLAKHHIGGRVLSTCLHPDDLELDVTYKSLKHDMDDRRWVIYLRPKKVKA